MRFAFLATAFCLLSASLVLSKGTGTGAYISLVNLTPHDWKLVYTHSYQVQFEGTPQVIPSGSTQDTWVEFHLKPLNNDCAGEITYELVSSPLPASFTLRARDSGGKLKHSPRLEIQYNDELSSLNNPKHSLINIGFPDLPGYKHGNDGGVLFVLAGNGTTPYISTNPPIGWMQATLATIGSNTLREICMPDSHDAGMSEITLQDGGVPHNCQNQKEHIYKQLVSGARWFDIRPAIRKGTWFTSHYSEVAGSMMGAMGRSLNDIIDDINKFTSSTPGEFIVLDLSHELTCTPKCKSGLEDEKWQELYILLRIGIHDIWSSPQALPNDLTTVPLSTFISPGSKSAVLIRIPYHAPPFGGQVGKRQSTSSSIFSSGIIPSLSLPFHGSFSSTTSPHELASTQLAQLTSLRTSPQDEMLRSTWTLTQDWRHVTDAGNVETSILADALGAHQALYSKIWKGLSATSWPNLVEVDDMDSQITALAMAINEYYVGMGGRQGER